MIRARALDAHMPAGDRARHQVGAALDAIGQHLVGRAAQPLDALDHDLVGAGALDVGTHGHQEVGEIHYFGFPRGVLQDGFAVGEGRRHHQVLGAGDRHRIEHQPRALEAPGAGANVTALDGDVGTHRLQPRDVNVHRPRTDGAAARQRYVSAPVARHQGTQHQDRGAHGLHQIVGCEALLDGRSVHLDAHALVDGDGGAHPPEQLDRRGHVLQMRHVSDHHRVLGEQRCGENRQGGVLGPGNPHLTFERHTALDLQLIHGLPRPWITAAPIPVG